MSPYASDCSALMKECERVTASRTEGVAQRILQSAQIQASPPTRCQDLCSSSKATACRPCPAPRTQDLVEELGGLGAAEAGGEREEAQLRGRVDVLALQRGELVAQHPGRQGGGVRRKSQTRSVYG